MGAYFGIHLKEVVVRRYDSKSRFFASAILVLSLLAESVIGSSQLGHMIPIRLLQIPLIWIVADVLAAEKEPRWWMKISFFIFCSHSLILEAVEKCFFIGLGDTQTGAVVDFIFAPTITLEIIIVLAFFTKEQNHLVSVKWRQRSINILYVNSLTNKCFN